MIELLLLNSLLILGIHKNSGYDDNDRPQVFTWLHKINAPWWLKKPLIECMSCMASIHSLYVYWPYICFVKGFSLTSVLAYLVYVPALAGLNCVLDRITTINECEKINETQIRRVVNDVSEKM